MWSPTLRLVVALVLQVAGCASDPTPMYAGPELPAERVAILEDSYNTYIFAIDGVAVFGDAWSLTPGSYTIWVRAQVIGTAPNVVYKGWTYCEIAFDASAGRTYRTAVDKREKLSGALGKEVSIDIRIVDETGHALAYPRRCLAKRPIFKE